MSRDSAEVCDDVLKENINLDYASRNTVQENPENSRS
jgi:hypothetical protein